MVARSSTGENLLSMHNHGKRRRSTTPSRRSFAIHSHVKDFCRRLKKHATSPFRKFYLSIRLFSHSCSIMYDSSRYINKATLFRPRFDLPHKKQKTSAPQEHHANNATRWKLRADPGDSIHYLSKRIMWPDKISVADTWTNAIHRLYEYVERITRSDLDSVADADRRPCLSE
jgi:hypothetical protein